MFTGNMELQVTPQVLQSESELNEIPRWSTCMLKLETPCSTTTLPEHFQARTHHFPKQYTHGEKGLHVPSESERSVIYVLGRVDSRMKMMKPQAGRSLPTKPAAPIPLTLSASPGQQPQVTVWNFIKLTAFIPRSAPSQNSQAWISHSPHKKHCPSSATCVAHTAPP
jgi:hypothetical protein